MGSTFDIQDFGAMIHVCNEQRSIEWMMLCFKLSGIGLVQNYYRRGV